MCEPGSSDRISRVLISHIRPEPGGSIYLTIGEALGLHAALTAFLARPEKYRDAHSEPGDNSSHIARIDVCDFELPLAASGPLFLRPHKHTGPSGSSSTGYAYSSGKDDRPNQLFPHRDLSDRVRYGLLKLAARNNRVLSSLTYKGVLHLGRKKFSAVERIGAKSQREMDDVMESQGLLDDWLATDGK